MPASHSWPHCRQNNRRDKAEGAANNRTTRCQTVPVYCQKQQRKVGAGCDRGGKRKKVGDILPLTRQSKQDPKYAQCHRSDPRYPEPHALIELPTGQTNDEIVSSRGGTCYEQTGDNGQDRRERNR